MFSGVIDPEGRFKSIASTANSPDVAVQDVYHALTDQHPKAIYYSGKSRTMSAYALKWLICLLPDRFIDKLLAKMS